MKAGCQVYVQKSTPNPRVPTQFPYPESKPTSPLFDVKIKRYAETTIQKQCSGLDHNNKANVDVPSIVASVVQLRGNRAAPAVNPTAV